MSDQEGRGRECVSDGEGEEGVCVMGRKRRECVSDGEWRGRECVSDGEGRGSV